MSSKSQSPGGPPSRSVLVRVGLRLVWLTVGLVLALLLGELLVTVLHGPTVRFPRRVVEAPWGLRYNEPGAHYGHHSPDVDIDFRINRQGMRADRDYAYVKPAAVRRIVCLGDSFTAGYEVQQEETFASVLERELQGRGLNVEVLNAGVSGFSTAEEVLYLERELWRYEPDCVVLSFFANDLADNLRTGLFGLEEGRAVARAERYVPMGKLGNFLNTNPVFNYLSERSNLMALLKERVTLQVKSRMVTDNLPGSVTGEDGTAEDPKSYERRLAAALLQRLLDWCRDKQVLLVVQSIPEGLPVGPTLRDDFPYAEFPVDQEGMRFVRIEEFLSPWLGKELLYWTRSHFHWTPFAHRLSGERLAEVIAQAWNAEGAGTAPR
jgi:GDSL-like Lipase/Acylhydrolase family